MKRLDILNERTEYNSNIIIPNKIKEISKVLKYVEIKKSTIFNKNEVVGILNKLTEKILSVHGRSKRFPLITSFPSPATTTKRRRDYVDLK